MWNVNLTTGFLLLNVTWQRELLSVLLSHFTHEYLWIISYCVLWMCCVNTAFIISSCVCQWEWTSRVMQTTCVDRALPPKARGGGTAGRWSQQWHATEEDSKDRWKTACMWDWKRRWDGGWGDLQNNSITDTASAGNKGRLFWVLIKVFYRRPKGKQCTRKLESNHSPASKDCHYLT